MSGGAGAQGRRRDKKKPPGPAPGWNEAEVERQAEIGPADVEAARLYLKRRGLWRAARLLEAQRAETRIPLE